MKLTTLIYTGSSKTSSIHVHTSSRNSRKLSTNGDQTEDKSFCLTDKLLIALCTTLGCLDGQCAYFLVLKPGRKYAPISRHVLKSQMHLKIHAYGIFTRNFRVTRILLSILNTSHNILVVYIIISKQFPCKSYFGQDEKISTHENS